MTADVELLPLPAIERWKVTGDYAFPTATDPEGHAVDYDAHVDAMQSYARACVAHATAAKDAEIEALRAEVALLRHGNVAYAQQVAGLIGRAGNAEARAERLQEEAEQQKAWLAWWGRFASQQCTRAEQSEARAERLAEALRNLLDVGDKFTGDKDEDAATWCDVTDAARAALHPTAAQEGNHA